MQQSHVTHIVSARLAPPSVRPAAPSGRSLSRRPGSATGTRAAPFAPATPARRRSFFFPSAVSGLRWATQGNARRLANAAPRSREREPGVADGQRQRPARGVCLSRQRGAARVSPDSTSSAHVCPFGRPSPPPVAPTTPASQ